jgi:serine/threonine-protein kinase
MTEIYEVEAPGGRCLAKVLRREFLSVPQIADRFRLEADILEALEHPNIVRLLDRGSTGEGRPFFVLERLAGHTLRRELVQRGALPVLEASNFTLQALDGVSAIHRAGIVHRDLKPDNLFVCRAKDGDRRIKILDFGFAKVLERRGSEPRIAPLVISTTEQEFVGAPRFVAPEQLIVGKAVDHRADLYTLGLVLYTLVLGREPHHDIESRDGLLRAHLDGKLRAPSPETAERVSKELLAIIARATATSRTARFASADEFSSELREFVSGRSGPAPSKGAKRLLTVRQHAEMTAAIEAHPEQGEAIRRRYGIATDHDARAVDKWWERNFGADEQARAKWRELVDLFAVRLRSGRRSS